MLCDILDSPDRRYDHSAKTEENNFSTQMALAQIWFYDPDGNGIELAQLPATQEELFPDYASR